MDDIKKKYIESPLLPNDVVYFIHDEIVKQGRKKVEKSIVVEGFVDHLIIGNMNNVIAYVYTNYDSSMTQFYLDEHFNIDLFLSREECINRLRSLK